ncbi:hypothetical protein [Bacteroides acidifaciens]|uniref:hypothetical protein n=1 Tax=Bacteroides acidifaciens TaxID=85831 RepID=UPI0025B36B9B|nr:hypothetical protein [Bacteroides acidifaciens]
MPRTAPVSTTAAPRSWTALWGSACGAGTPTTSPLGRRATAASRPSRSSPSKERTASTFPQAAFRGLMRV